LLDKTVAKIFIDSQSYYNKKECFFSDILKHNTFASQQPCSFLAIFEPSFVGLAQGLFQLTKI